MVERTALLTLIEISPWDTPAPLAEFQITICSSDTSAVLFQKNLKSAIISQKAIFDFSIRVNYTTEENQIVVKLSLVSRGSQSPVGQFVLNLDQIVEQKAKNFLLNSQKTIKIAVYGPRDSQTLINGLQSTSNEQFIREKEDFLRKISSPPTSFRPKADKSPGSSFSEKTFGLLTEIKRLKIEKKKERSTTEEDCDQALQYQGNPASSFQSVVKRSSTTVFNGLQRQNNLRDQVEFTNRSQQSPNHRLMLRTLEMLPCAEQNRARLPDLSRQWILFGSPRGSSKPQD